MTDTPDDGSESRVQLTPEAPKAEPKLAVVRPGPRAVTVKVPTAKPVTAAEEDTPAPVAEGEAVSDVVKKGALLDEVVATTGVKRSDAKAVAEALFSAISVHLQDDKTLQLPPLGKLRLAKVKDVGQGGKAMTVKIRTPNAE